MYTLHLGRFLQRHYSENPTDYDYDKSESELLLANAMLVARNLRSIDISDCQVKLLQLPPELMRLEIGVHSRDILCGSAVYTPPPSLNELTIQCSFPFNHIWGLNLREKTIHIDMFPKAPTNLKVLKIFGNNFDIAGFNASYLSQLTMLHLQNNIDELPKGLAQMTSLEELDLSYNPLKSLAELTLHANLTRIVLRGCPPSIYIPSSLRPFVQF